MLAARRGIGITDENQPVPLGRFQHRVKVAWISAIWRGGVHIITWYPTHSIGPAGENIALMAEVAAIISTITGPWILCGDCNMTPQQIESTGWLNIIGAYIVAPGRPKCHSSTYDFFIIPISLRHAIAGLQLLEDAGLSPLTRMCMNLIDMLSVGISKPFTITPGPSAAQG